MTDHHHAQHLDELLLVRGSPTERADLEAHLATCEECSLRRAELEDACAELALTITPVPTSPGLRPRLLAALDHLERFTPMAPRLAELADISTNEARLALHIFERPEEMPPAPVPGLRLAPLPTGPRRRAAEATLACFAPGAGFPHHRHLGEERILIFQGALRTDDGRVARAGEELRSPAGSAHAIALVLGDEPCLCAILNEGGIEVAQ